MFNYGEYVYSQGLAKGRAEGRDEGRAEERENSLKMLISTLKEVGLASADVISKVAEKFGMTEEEARQAYEKYA